MTLEFMDVVLTILNYMAFILTISATILILFVIFAYERICRIIKLLEDKDE